MTVAHRTGLLPFAVVLLAAALGCGQGTRRNGPPTPQAEIDVVNLRVMPAAVNMDDEPGADGLRASVYLFQKQRPEPVTVMGHLQFELYGGRVRRREVETARPLKIWRYTGQELRAHLARTIVGWHYTFSLDWGETPRADAVTLLARYYPPEGGKPVMSSPLTIAMKP